MKGKRVPLWKVVLVCLLGLTLFKVLHVEGNIWLLMPLIITLLVYFVKFMSKYSFINNAFIKLGEISLESYLTNITINSLLCVLIPAYISSYLFHGRYLEYSFVIIVGLALAHLTNKMSGRIVKSLVC